MQTHFRNRKVIKTLGANHFLNYEIYSKKQNSSLLFLKKENE